MSFCGLVSKEGMVKAVEPHVDQRVGKIGELGGEVG